MERISKRLGAAEPSRPATLVIGIIGGMAPAAAGCAAGIALVAPNGIAAALVEGAAPTQLDGTDSGPTEAACPIPAEMAGIPVPVDANRVVEPSPADCAAPNSLAAVLTARAAFAVLPAVKSRESMLIGIVAIRRGVLREFSIDSDDVEDDDDDVESVVDDARLSTAWGDARLCRVCGIPEISCGPDDISVSVSIPPDVPFSPAGLAVCGGVANGVTCAALADALA